jgi:hypothetical protein
VVAEIDVFAPLLDALSFAFGMFWEILWALILGFALSGAVRGGRVEGRDATADARRLAENARDRLRRRRRLLVVLLCRGRPRALSVQERRELHRGDGLRVRLHEPGHL